MKSNQKQINYCKKLIINTKATYSSIKKIYCPILEEYVVFNAKGFHHLLYKSDGTSRDIAEKIYKLTLFPLAIPVIKNSIGIIEERNVKIRENRKKNAKIKKGKTYTLVVVVGKKKPVATRVIILKVGNGNFMFWSIMKDNKLKTPSI